MSIQKSVSRLIAVSLFCLGLSAEATQERYVFDFNHTVTQGQVQIDLKSMLNQQYRMNPDFYDLVSVSFEAKTRFGRGGASLQIGNWRSQSQAVQGQPGAFDSFDPRTYSYVQFFNQSYNSFESQGPWLILLDGQFRLNRMEVIVENRQSPPPPPPRPPRPPQPPQPPYPPRPPQPPQPPYPPQYEYEQVSCYSNNQRYLECPITRPGFIESIRITRQVSMAPCRIGESFGITQRRNAIWADRGCRAQFEVTIRH